MTDGHKKRTLSPSWAGVVVAALTALGAITVQWGVVTTKLDDLEKRLDEMIFETRSLRGEYQDVQRRLAILEGQHQSGARANP